MTLTPEQTARAIEVMQEYLHAPPTADGKTPSEKSLAGDKERVELIDDELKQMVEAYLASKLPLDEFKSKVDGINKRHENWGFKGIKGQMFFNMVVNVAHDAAECDQEIKAAIAIPNNEDIARSRIRTFASYVRRIGDAHVEGGGTKQGRPKPGSIPFFMSYFWQIQDRRTWPVYYTNSVNTMIDLNLWQPTEDLAEDYIAFKHLHEELAEVFTKASGRPFDLYGVEHVFWFKGGNPYGGQKAVTTQRDETVTERPPPTTVDEAPNLVRLPDSYLPPIIAVLPRIALNEAGFDALAKASRTSLPKAFEKSIHAAFTILGYDTKLLGQDRHRWMKSLGNNFIQTRSGPNIQIAEPGTADELLDLAIVSARHKQRLLSFCSCQWPRCNGEIHCHRATVAELVLETAKKRRVPVEIVEWPGGEPKQIEFDVMPKIFSSVRKGRMTVLLGNGPDLAKVGRLSWCSIATIQAKGENLHRIVGPAISQTTGWALPVFPFLPDPSTGLSEFEREAEKLRRAWGLNHADAGFVRSAYDAEEMRIRARPQDATTK